MLKLSWSTGYRYMLRQGTVGHAYREIHLLKAMNLNLTDLFMIEPMHAGSVNGWIYIPPSFTLMVYCVIIGITTVMAVFFLMKKSSLLQAYRKSMVIAFFCAGFLYLVYSERTWYTWVRKDLNTYSGYSTEAKIGICLGPLDDFIRVAREVLQYNDYLIYCPHDGTRLITQYYLLPRRNRVNAKYIIVLHDNDAAYDGRTKTFIRGNRHTENAELLFRPAFGAYILRVK
jgi:hypothetical protein